MLLRTFGFSFLVTVVGLVAAFLHAGPSALAIAAILIVLEVSLSFDNAVVNAKVLRGMSQFWQMIFLTVGILIAVFGMRLLFPFVVVWASAGLPPTEAWELAMAGEDVPQGEETYAEILEAAHPVIAAFGGIFLMMIFLDFFLDSEKERHWLKPVEKHFQTLGQIGGAAIVISLGLLLGLGYAFEREELGGVLAAGILGLLTYLFVTGLGDLFARTSGIEDRAEEASGSGGSSSGASEGSTGQVSAAAGDPGTAGSGRGGVGTQVEHDAESAQEIESSGSAGQLALATGKAAFFMFLYLEVLDASFSFDGVIGAFAITSDPITIAIGLGVGALYVRSITVYLVRKGTLSQFVYLEHGAHWAIGALAVLLFITMGVHIPEVVTGLIGVVFIVSSFLWSVRHNKRHPEESHVDV
ncbi:DUF475 domain-containing protein [Nocardioides perillae]|uniref:DUF475 domain-containing protein n=1 Tax=Nocardioides perillae TaxID=1119534 RepID=A0A7Y9RRD4_9ACTN|nr:hypothetical protein [Nocardioides perillae]